MGNVADDIHGTCNVPALLVGVDVAAAVGVRDITCTRLLDALDNIVSCHLIRELN